MRFVPVKSIEQQSVLSLHRVRQGFVRARTAQANQIRGLLAEFGIVVHKGRAYLASSTRADRRCRERTHWLVSIAHPAPHGPSE
jgi:transposase